MYEKRRTSSVRFLRTLWRGCSSYCWTVDSDSRVCEIEIRSLRDVAVAQVEEGEEVVDVASYCTDFITEELICEMSSKEVRSV